MPFGVRKCPTCGEDLWACPYCKETFTTKQKLRKHLKDVHDQPGAP